MFYTYNNKKVYYTLSGSGHCVVLLHGFTEDSGIWHDYTAVLSKQFTVLSPDLPGHGMSEHWDMPHTMEEQANLIRELIEINGIESIVLIGHSMGGYIAMAFAEAYPAYLRGLCLLHSSAIGDSTEVKAYRDKVIDIVRKNKFGFLAQFIPDLFAPDNRIKYDNEIQKLIARASNMKPEGLINAIEGMKQRPDRQHVLHNLMLPVLFIAGKMDNRIPLEVILSQLTLPAHAEALILRNVGHMGYLEAKNDILITINNFINKNYSK